MRLQDDLPQEELIGGRDLTSWPSRLGSRMSAAAVASTRLLGPRGVLAMTALLGAVVATGLTVASAAIYDAVDEGEGVAGFDRPALETAISLRTPFNTNVATWFTQLGGPAGMTVLATCVVVALAIRWRSRTPLLLMVIGVAGSLAMTRAGKVVVGRARPPRIDAVPPFESSPSFPSGHTLNSTVIAGILAYLVLRRLTSHQARVATVILAIIWSLSMGVSRVFLGHHWLTDVMVGWTLGLAWLAVIITAHRLFLTVRRRAALAQGRPGGHTAYPR